MKGLLQAFACLFFAASSTLSSPINVESALINSLQDSAVNRTMIELKPRGGQYFQLFMVFYTDNPFSDPSVPIIDLYGGSNPYDLSPTDINKGFKGKYVYLIPQYTSDTQQAAVNINSYHQSKPQAGNMDLAKGAGGDYRYLSVNTNGPGLPTLPLINQVALLRSSERQNGPPNGYAGITNDINAGRGGDYLYIIWST